MRRGRLSSLLTDQTRRTIGVLLPSKNYTAVFLFTFVCIPYALNL